MEVIQPDSLTLEQVPCHPGLTAPAGGQSPLEGTVADSPAYTRTASIPLAEDTVINGLTYYADGTDLMMVWDGGRKGRRVTAVGIAHAKPYEFQACRYADGTVHNVAPHVLHRD